VRIRFVEVRRMAPVAGHPERIAQLDGFWRDTILLERGS
jgi:hypothetical protein